MIVFFKYYFPQLTTARSPSIAFSDDFNEQQEEERTSDVSGYVDEDEDEEEGDGRQQQQQQDVSMENTPPPPAQRRRHVPSAAQCSETNALRTGFFNFYFLNSFGVGGNV